MEYKINTSIPIEFEKIEEIEDSRFTKCKVWICHTGKNLNNSYFSKEVIENELLPSLPNIPILGFIQVDSNNEKDFTGHEERLIVDNNGVYVEYLGRSYGLIPESHDAKFEKKICSDGIEREYLTSTALLWNKFDNAIDILNRDEEKSVSMELNPNSMEGKFSKEDNLFHFTKAQFDGVCILGTNILPGMSGALINKFSKSIQSEFSQILSEFNNIYSNIKSQQNFTKEDNNLDEMLELLKQFSITQEQILEFDNTINFENISVEDLQIKINEYQASQLTPENLNTDPNVDIPDNQNFSLTSEQLAKELRDKLREEKFVDRWGYTCNRYYYLDYTENAVFAEDNKDNWNIYKFEFSMSGDNVIIDFKSAKKQKAEFVDWVDGSAEFSFVPTEYMENVIEYQGNLKEEDLNKSFSLEKQDINKNFNAEIQTLNETITSLKEDNKSLSEFKYNKLKTEREAEENELFSKFAEKLTDEEITEFKKTSHEFTIDQLESKLFECVGRKNITFSKKTKKETDFARYSFNLNSDNNVSDKPYAEIIQKHVGTKNNK